MLYVIPSTVRYWLTQRKAVIEYKLMGSKYVPTELDDGHQVVFTFVWVRKYASIFEQGSQPI